MDLGFLLGGGIGVSDCSLRFWFRILECGLGSLVSEQGLILGFPCRVWVFAKWVFGVGFGVSEWHLGLEVQRGVCDWGYKVALFTQGLGLQGWSFRTGDRLSVLD